MEIYVSWGAEKPEKIETYLERYREELDHSAFDSKFENGSEKVTIDGNSVFYTGPGGTLHDLLEGRDDLEVKAEEENTVEYPYGVTD